MPVCVDFTEIEGAQRKVVQAMKEAGQSLDAGRNDSCDVVARKVRQVERAVVMVYELAVIATRREEHLDAILPVWNLVVQFCDFTLEALRGMTGKFPSCGTSELYDLTLDYRNQAQKRRTLFEEEAQCQTTIPERLFPDPN